ncbi:glycosyltransferase family 4 protein [Lysobacter sp. Hz 25]|uniref:glycosyltransferase family 4 protein n=1 Tax=Lysobacter sp. Hz 25 TaxID=3383698 RepID=UPI0038D4AED8
MAPERLSALWYITRKFLPDRGGMQRLSFHIADELAALAPLTLVRWRRGQWGLPLFAAWALARLSWGLLRGQVRVLLIGDPVLSFLAVPAQWAGVPVAVVVHGLDVTYPHRFYRGYLRRFFWRRFDLYICISRFVQGVLREHGVDEARCALIHPGVGPPPFAAPVPARSERRLLILGRLVRRKGVLWFVREVMPRLGEAHAQWHLDVVGDGPDRADLEAAMAQHGLGERIRLHGDVDEATKFRLLAQSDLVLMPNLRVEGDPEGFGLVALEAGMSRRYVLAADLEGLRDAVCEPDTGLLLPPQDAQAWCETLERLCVDPMVLRELGERAQAHVAARSSWAGMGRRYAERLDELA